MNLKMREYAKFIKMIIMTSKEKLKCKKQNNHYQINVIYDQILYKYLILGV